MRCKKENNTNGFTLIELMVAMGIFVILMTIAIGGFVHSLKNQRIAAALMAANDSAGLTMEMMARELRTGYNFCLISSSKIQFVNAYDQLVRYSYNLDNLDGNEVGIIEKGVNDIDFARANEDCSSGDSADGNYDYKKLTADNVNVLGFNIAACGNNIDGNISLNDCASGEIFPPRITVLMSVTSPEAGIDDLGISVNLQTTVSARRID